MEVAFGKEGLAGWEFEGPRIRIPRGQQARFMAALAKNDAMPRRSGDYIEKALSGTNVLMDAEHRKALIKAAHERELAGRIRLMPKIQDASVMYDTGTKRGISPEILATAAVSVTPKGSQPLTAQEARSIRKLVASAIVGLKPENVEVVDLKHPENSFGDAGSGDPLADVLAAKTRTWQEKFKKDIEERLANIKDVLVSVSVQLDTTKSTRKVESKVEPKGTPVSIMSKSRTKTREGTVPAGPAGFVANQPQAIRAAQGKGTRDEEEEAVEQTVNAVSRSSIETDVVGNAPKRVTASIGIPTSYFESVWRTRQAIPAGIDSKKPPQAELDQIRTQEIKKIQDAILPLLLPYNEGETDMTKALSVVEFPDIPPEQLPEPGIPELVTGWLVENWRMLGLIVLALASLVMLRSMVRSVPAPEEPARTPAAQAAGQTAAEPAKREETAAERRLKRLSGSGPTLRDELSQLVSEDPEAAANILRTWIGNVS
jgi:flagellar M-ring protein FliF